MPNWLITALMWLCFVLAAAGFAYTIVLLVAQQR
jgi:hypothetical protein